MTASNIHRKILQDPSNSTEVCKFPCDPLINPLTCKFPCVLPPLPPLPLPPELETPAIKHHHSSLSLPLKISLVILVLTFSFFLLYTLYKFYTVWYRSRRRRSPPQPQPENQETHEEFLDQDVLDHPIWYIRTIGLQPSVINTITVVKYNKTDGLIDGNSCSVCLSDFQENETLRLLPKCNHAFHVSCIDTWLRSHTNCPLCRAGIVKNRVDLSSSGRDLENLGGIEETEDDDVEQREREDDDVEQICDDEDESKGEIVGGSGTSDLFVMRRSVSLNDYEACRVRSDVYSNNNNNNKYYSDRHDVHVQILQSVDGNLGFELVKVDRTVNNNRP